MSENEIIHETYLDNWALYRDSYRAVGITASELGLSVALVERVLEDTYV